VVFTFGVPTGGSALTIDLAKKCRQPWHHVDLKAVPPKRASADLRLWIEREGVKVLNVAGSRESNAPGIQELVKTILIQTFGSGRS